MYKISGTLSQTSGSISGSLSNTKQSVSGALARISDHTTLAGRDAADQHPIDAITNLEPELEWRPSSALTNADIQLILES